MGKKEEAGSGTSEVKSEETNNLSQQSSEVVKLSLEDYLRTAKVNIGLQASFRYEAREKPDMLEPKTAEGWKSAFQAQSKRVYK